MSLSQMSQLPRSQVFSIYLVFVHVLLLWAAIHGMRSHYSAYKAAKKKQSAVPPPPAYDVWGDLAQSVRAGHRSVFLIPPSTRDKLGAMLESMGGFHVGVELGVQRGLFAKQMLQTWPSCSKYYLVDIWHQQTNYNDLANVADQEQLRIYNEAHQNLAEFRSKTVFLKNYTRDALQFIPGHVDFIYVDARHDYCGVMEDLTMYWPKLRPGGIMAGHDYNTALDVWPDQDWALCMNGTKIYSAVQGAVNDFMVRHGLTLSVTWGEDNMFR
eukprot:CAMPEP_0202866250 /NCGR_PEP_ID=MMETSP1391-20130828/7284_1 /ASSEMBLY_ACC=CAM_ASM_000867 /TAXON_ID=1034604 /ORGANISM="Chlamydomonas leiostraca, Strain SAG 11-49" /LENGTH=268 /DNA_ID=CAMNT_0049546183 /DNA_START=279 /DNA_END=1082 /DNA_ORIENTATION=+